MNLDEKYLGRITFPERTKKTKINDRDAYSLPCPECSKRPNAPNPNKRRFVLMYSKYNSCYAFSCRMCGVKGNLLTYLQRYHPILADEYLQERWEKDKATYKEWEKKRWYPTNDLPFNFKPNFESHKN